MNVLGTRRLSLLAILGVLAVAALGRADDNDQYHRDEMERYRKAMDKIWEGPGPAIGPYGAESFAAIAYSQTTHAYGYSWNYNTRAGAMRGALKACGKADAKIIIVTRNNFCALAVGDEGAVGANGYSAAQAKANALAGCRQYKMTNYSVVVIVFAGN